MAHKIVLEAGDVGGTYVIAEVRKHGQDHLVQTDWDRPAAARLFGWLPRKRKGCHHRGTDGTVTCPDCGTTASEFIAEATDFLDRNLGKVILSDYFENFECIEERNRRGEKYRE
jgi:hypothetical protein